MACNALVIFLSSNFPLVECPCEPLFHRPAYWGNTGNFGTLAKPRMTDLTIAKTNVRLGDTYCERL